MDKKGIFLILLMLVGILTVQTVSATLTPVSPGNNSWTNETNNTIQFQFNFTAGLGGTVNCTLRIDSVDSGTNTSTTSGEITTIYANDTINEGARSWLVNCTNGTATEQSGAWILNIDITPPTVDLNTPANGTSTSNNEINFNWTVNDIPAGILLCNLTIDGVVNQTDIPSQNGTPTNYSVSGFSDGTHSWSVTCIDNVNYSHTSEPIWYVTVDTADPTSSITSPDNNTWTTDSTPEINFTLTDNLDPNEINYTVYVDGSANGQIGYVNNNTPTLLNISPALTNGTHVIIVEAMDEATNKVNSTPLTINVDQIDPVISFTSPANNSWTNNDTVTVKYTITDNLDTSISYSIYANVIAGDPMTLKVSGSASNGTLQEDLIFDGESPTDGEHTFYVQATDDAGNSVNSTLLYVWMDRVNATSVINSPANNTWTTDDTPEINFTLSDNLDPNQINYTIYVDGAVDVTGYVNNNTATLLNISSMSNGTHTIIVEAMDEAQNKYNSTPLTINVDQVDPTIFNLTSPANNSNQTSRNVVFNFTSYDNLDTILNYTLYINGSANTTGLTTGNNTATDLTVTMADGDYSWLIGLTDEVGNKANSSEYVFSLTCAESWTCTSWSDWSTCSGGTQTRTRTCTDQNSCGTTTNKPDVSESQSCTVSSTGGGITVTKTTLGTEPKTVTLDMTDKAVFTVDDKKHYAQIKKIYTNHVIVTVRSDSIDVDLYVNKTEKVDVDDDGVYDLAMTLEKIYTSRAKITFETIEEKVPEVVPEEVEEEAPVEEVPVEEVPSEEEVEEAPPEEEIPPSRAWIVWLIVAIVVIIAVVYYTKKKPRKKAQSFGF